MASLDLDEERSWQLPVMLTVALVLVAGSRFEATRSIEAGFFAFGFPVLAPAFAVARLRESSDALRNTGFGIAAGFAITAELRIARAFEIATPELAAIADSSVTVWLLIVLVAAGAVVQAVAAYRGMRTFIAAWMGMAAALAIYLPGHFTPSNERFGQVIAALLVALVAGGGPGFFAGALLSSFVRPRDAAK